MTECLGARVIPCPSKKVIETHQAVDLKAAQAEAQKHWIEPAKKIVEPKRREPAPRAAQMTWRVGGRRGDGAERMMSALRAGKGAGRRR